jgi:cytochrome c
MTVATSTTAAAHPDHPTILVFSKTAGFRHDSIPAGIAAITELGAQNDIVVEATEDAAAFTDANLDRFSAVIWLSTTGDVLNEEQQAAFERYINHGGGYAGVHSAADTEYDWPWYGGLVGAYFQNHPQIQPATVRVPNHDHPSTVGIPDVWQRTDEWYNYRTNPRAQVKVLATLDESTYSPGNGAMGDHPIAWCHTQSEGRSWYTGLGHTIESYAEANFRTHLLGGIKYAAGVLPGDCAAEQGVPVDSDFDQITLAKGQQYGEPMALAVLPDRRVLHTARDGRVWLTTPAATTTLAAQIPVYTHDEDGLQGIAVDANFATNRWVYLLYAPPLSTPAGDAPNEGTAADFARFNGHNQISRFRLTDAGTLDLTSEQQILQIPTSRGICCHVGGEIDFDAAGNLYVSTGDDTNPFQSSGFTPIDERANRNPAYDAQRTSSNTNDLRGKLLRIRVADDGSYTIPAGNLFAPGTAQTKPEIYAMGFRNPFRFAIDRPTGTVYLGDYGPDAGAPNPARGPGGAVEFNRITQAANFGWPYCHGGNAAYIDFDFGTNASGSAFNCTAPVNASPNNTGQTNLPPSQAAWITYDGGSIPEFGTGSESPMGGPVYRFDPNNPAVTKFPQYFDGKFFAYDWGRGWIKEITVGPNGERGEIKPFFDSMDLQRPMAVEFGPDGSMYVLDYGSGPFFSGAEDSAVYRIDFTRGNRTPRVTLNADRTSGPSPLTVRFDPTGTHDPDQQPLSYAWDFDGNGTTDSTVAGPVEFTYATRGQFQARLSVTDPAGLTGVRSLTITSGNTAPAVSLQFPVDGGFFGFGDTVPFKVSVTDPEDPAIDCSRVTLAYNLGHDQHSHPITSTTGCTGVLQTPSGAGHGDSANVFGGFIASYTDTGAPGVPALTTIDRATLQPKRKQAEFFNEMSGIQIVSHAAASGGRRVGFIENGDWIKFDPVNLAGVTSIGYRVSSGGAGGTIEVRTGSITGPLVQTVPVANTGGWDTYADIAPIPVTDPGGTGPLFLVFKGGAGGLFDVDLINVQGEGVADRTAPVTQARFAGGEWHTGQVLVELVATDNSSGVERIEFKLDNGAWTRYTGTITVSGDGVHTLLYRAVDNVGNTEADKAATIKIDGTRPTLLVSGVANGRVYGDATDVVISWQAEDATSGVASVVGTLDGQPVTSGNNVALYQLPLGFHALSVTATDRAGNRTEQTLTFATTTSMRDIGQLLDRFRATNRLSLSAHTALSSQLAKARKAEANGNDAKAVRELRTFVTLANDTTRVPAADIRQVLDRDARAVIDSIEGLATLPVATDASG